MISRIITVAALLLGALAEECPPALRFGDGPPTDCTPPTDPNGLPAAPLESWFTRDHFDALFPKANLGWGPHRCQPYSYEAFAIAARYFPEFGDEAPDNGYSAAENRRRDLAAFFAHAVQETGENDANLYRVFDNVTAANDCFYRGGFFNWFEGGPTSLFLPTDRPGYSPEDGDWCKLQGRYCASTNELDFWFPCNDSTRVDVEPPLYKGCYFGRGAIQISYNYNYGQLQEWLRTRRIFVDLLNEPNVLMTKRDPPLAMLASLWFYMTPQPPKPAMHDIVLGNWEPGEVNRAADFSGALFGPTSLVINNECNGEDAADPGGPGESRRIKAFKWFCAHFAVPAGADRELTCNGMPQKLEAIPHALSWQPDWQSSWREQACDCAPASYGGLLPYFAPGHYPARFVAENGRNRARCVFSVYDNPLMYSMDASTSKCLDHRLGFAWSRRGVFA